MREIPFSFTMDSRCIQTRIQVCGGCYTTYRPISIVTRPSVMQIETRVEKLGASCTMFGIRVFLNWIEKDGQCWTLTDLVLIHVSNVVHFNPFFCDLIRRDNRCCLDLSFRYFFIRKDKGDRFIKNFFFQILKIVIEIWVEKFQCYARVLRVIIKYLFIFVSLFFISNMDPIRDKSYVFFKRYSKIYQIYRTTLRTEFKNWYLNVTKIVVEKKKTLFIGRRRAI